MKQIKIFKTNNKDILIIQDRINDWIEKENIEVYNLEIVNGIEHKNNKFSNFDEIELFFVILYSKN